MINQTDTIEQTDWSDFVEQLHKYFYEHAAEQCLLWVNPAQADPFNDDALVNEQRIRVPISHRRFDVLLGPYLVPLDLSRSADSDLLRASVEMAWDAWTPDHLEAMGGQPISGWVATTEEPSALANHWAMRCHLHQQNGLSKFLRFHDPSVREWLWHSFTQIQKRAVLGSASRLFAIGRDQILLSHDAEESAYSPSQHAGEVAKLLPLKLDNLQWDQVHDYATAHAAWVAWMLPLAEN